MSFPVPLADVQDSKYFGEEQIDSTVSGELEGGYKHTRARSTRTPRKRFTTGFTQLTDSLKGTLETFFDARGTHTSFVYTHPVSAVTYTVRFNAAPRFKYVGMGGNHLWTVSSLVLEEV